MDLASKNGICMYLSPDLHHLPPFTHKKGYSTTKERIFASKRTAVGLGKNEKQRVGDGSIPLMNGLRHLYNTSARWESCVATQVATKARLSGKSHLGFLKGNLVRSVAPVIWWGKPNSGPMVFLWFSYGFPMVFLWLWPRSYFDPNGMIISCAIPLSQP